MNTEIDRYLSTLLSFAPGPRRTSRIGGDYASLIHIPVTGPEKVYSVAFGDEVNILTVARYRETIWEYMSLGMNGDPSPQVNVLQAEVETSHPVFEILDENLLTECENRSDGGPGLEYCMLVWQKSGHASVAECWEPYGRNDEDWISLIGSMEVLSSQYEYAVADSEL